VPYELNIPWYNALNADDPAEPHERKVRRFLASRAIALALPGVPAVYLPSVIGAHVTADHPVNEKDPRSINRNTIHLQELLDQLERPESHASQILLPFTRMIEARTRCRAFHPAAHLRVVPLDPAVLGFVRESRDGLARVLVLISVSPDACEVAVPRAALGADAREWHDLITGLAVRVDEDDVLRVPLDAYGIWWLEPAATD
jgi:hypothetical protein